MKKLVILISGKKRSGKDYIGQVIYKYCNSLGYNTKLLSFACPLKEIVQKTFGISAKDLEHMKNNPDEYPLQIPQTDHTYELSNFREVLQKLGSEGIRDVLGDNTWKNYLYNSVKESTAEIFIVTDFRFINEATPEVEIPGLKISTVKVVNFSVQVSDTHASENGIPVSFEFGLTIDNTGHPEDKEIINYIKDKNLIQF